MIKLPVIRVAGMAFLEAEGSKWGVPNKSSPSENTGPLKKKKTDQGL